MISTVVIVLDVVLGLAAVAGGVYLLAGAPRLSRGWLRGTPFRSFFWPGILLLVLVGGSLLVAAGLLLADSQVARLVSMEAGLILFAWGAIPLTSAGYGNRLPLLPVGLGIAVAVLSFLLPAPG
jgi:hypothetical protein